MMFSNRPWYELSLLVLTFGEVLATDTCYFPDGEIAHNGVPCGPSPSKCCDGEGLCLSNGLCFQPSGNLLARSSCTDPTWSSSECTDICKNDSTDQFVALVPCGSNLFCCNIGPFGSQCCLGENSGTKFTVDDSTVQLPINDPSTVTITSTKTNVITSTETSTITSVIAASGGVFTSTETISVTVTTTSTSGGNNPRPVGQGDKTTTVTVCNGAATATSVGGSDSEKFSASCEDCTKKEIAIGAGVGAPLLLALIGALLLLFCRGKSFRRPWAHQTTPIAAALPDRGHMAPEFVGYGAATMSNYDGPRPQQQRQYQGYQTGNGTAAARTPSGVTELHDQTTSPVSFIDDGRHELAGQKNIYDHPPRY